MQYPCWSRKPLIVDTHYDNPDGATVRAWDSSSDRIVMMLRSNNNDTKLLVYSLDQGSCEVRHMDPRPHDLARHVALVGDDILFVSDKGNLARLSLSSNFQAHRNCEGVSILGAYAQQSDTQLESFFVIPSRRPQAVVHFVTTHKHCFAYIELSANTKGDCKFVKAGPASQHRVHVAFCGSTLYICNMSTGTISPVVI